MPAFKDKLSEEQVAKLVAYVRSFRGGAKAAKPPENDVEERFGRLEEQFHELQEESHELEEQSHESSKSARPSPEPGSDAKASSENSREPNAESRSPPMPDESSSPASAEETDEEKRFFTKLVGWLGKFHPMTVHFPIAMLVGAAVAELLLMVRDSPLLKSASRFCVWFGALTAVVAATLGWFLAGAHVSDPNWILTTHRWLGTSTVVCAAFVLFLSEVSRRGDRVARVGFRLALLLIVLLLMATGFFGGALIHPIDYYAWP